MFFLAITSPPISPQLHYFSHNAVIYSRHILAIFLARVKPLIHITRNRTPYRGAETATEDMLVPPEMPVNVCIEGNVTSSLSPSLRFLDFSRQTLQRSGFRFFFNLNVVFQRHFGTRAVTEYLGNGFDWRPVVVQPRTETTTECVESVPLDARAFQRLLDNLRPSSCQVQRETRGPSKTHVVPGFCFRCFFSSAITFGKRCTLAARCSVFVSMTSLCHTVRTTINWQSSKSMSAHFNPRSSASERSVHAATTTAHRATPSTASVIFSTSSNVYLCVFSVRLPSGISTPSVGFGP